MIFKFVTLEDGNEAILLTRESEFSNLVVAEPDKCWVKGTYAVVVSSRKADCSFVLPYVLDLDLGVRSVGAPCDREGRPIDLSNIPEEFCDLEVIKAICDSRYEQSLAATTKSKLQRVYFALEQAESDVYVAAPWLLDKFHAYVGAICKTDSFDVINEGWPENHWIPDEKYEKLKQILGQDTEGALYLDLCQKVFRP